MPKTYTVLDKLVEICERHSISIKAYEELKTLIITCDVKAGYSVYNPLKEVFNVAGGAVGGAGGGSGGNSGHLVQCGSCKNYYTPGLHHNCPAMGAGGSSD